MFQGWDTFFFLIGSSAGALIGLMFIVITLTAGHEPRSVERGAPVYVTPIVFHFAVVFIVSVISVVPGMLPSAVAVILGVCAIAGCVVVILGYHLRERTTHEAALQPI